MTARLDSVRRAYEALRAPGGLGVAADELLAPDVVLDFPALPDGAVMSGVEAYLEFRKRSPWSAQLSVEPEEMIEVAPDQVLVMVRVHTLAPALGAVVEGRFAHLMTFRGDRVVRWTLFTDRAEARRAAGLDTPHA